MTTLLDGFKVIPVKEKIEDTYLTISARSLKLNRATARILGMPEYVRFMLNEKRLQIAIVPAEPDDENAVEFASTEEEGAREKPIYVKTPAILKTIQKVTVLERDGLRLTQTIKGLAYPDDKVIIYDLTESVESVVKPRGRKKKEQAKI